MTARRRRSALYLPASNARAIEKARTLPCDVVILDLEDAVAPDMKDAARELAIAAVREGGFGSRELVIRVNDINSDVGKADLAALALVQPDAVLVPKVNDAAAIHAYAQAMNGTTPIWAMIETGISMFRLEEIAACAGSVPLTAFVIGTNDLAKEIGFDLGVDRVPFLGMLGMIVTAARIHGVAVIDGVFNDLEDSDGLVRQLKQAVQFGLDGKTLIHPNQVEPCNAAFMPDEKAIATAQGIIAAFNDPENADKGAIRVDGKMVERLHLHQAHRTLAAAGIAA